ncbi:RDD family protein [Nonomuraea sp. NPDC050451]|uniref:RDD family protein n=1 Tax=Nonomuraea sp. NPDC050451 TaxID=3364364 RepID=UPI003799EAE4
MRKYLPEGKSWVVSEEKQSLALYCGQMRLSRARPTALDRHARRLVAIIAWAAALAVAAYSTWDAWQVEYGSSYAVLGCVGSFGGGGFELTTVASALLGDAYDIADLAVLWGVPSILVLAGLLMSAATGNGAVIGRRVAGLLVLIAIVGPASPSYMREDGCSGIPVLSGEWFGTVLSAYGPAQYALLCAALLVLSATRTARDTWPSGSTGRRAAAFAIDYVIFVAFLSLFTGQLSGLDYGLLNWFRVNEPASLLAAVAAFLYVLTGLTFGKRLMRIRVVSAETGHWPGWRRAGIRALVFPVLVCVPQFGLAVLLVDGLWAMSDPAARTLRDRLAGTRVVRDLL